MRDGSLEDVIQMWIDRMIEERGLRYPIEDEARVYFVLLEKAVYGLYRTYDRGKPETDFRTLVTELLQEVRRGLSSRLGEPEPVDEAPEADPDELLEQPQKESEVPIGSHALYWSDDTWRKDFYTSFNRWFWDMKDYAHPAARSKSDFLWDVAEVWVAVGASALVYYAKDDRQRWFETAQMLRHFADLTEQDGLRSLSWGRWGRFAKQNHRPKPDKPHVVAAQNER